MSAVCPNCSSTNVSTRVVRDAFPYGSGEEAMQITAELPIKHCAGCGEEWEDNDTFRARHDAVCKHLGRLTSGEISEIRLSIGSRERFSDLTGVGVASLARWESGSHIQNAAYDLLLRVIADQRLRDHVFGIKARVSACVSVESAAVALSGANALTSVEHSVSNVIELTAHFRRRALTDAEEQSSRKTAEDFSLMPRRARRVGDH